MESCGGLVSGGGTIEDRLDVERDREGTVSGGKLIEFALAERASSELEIWPKGRAVVIVAEGRMTVTSVLGGKLTEGRLPDGRLSEGRLSEGKVAEGTVIVGTLADGRLIEPRLIEETPIELIETDGKLTDPRVGTGTPTYSTPTETRLGSATVDTLPL